MLNFAQGQQQDPIMALIMQLIQQHGGAPQMPQMPQFPQAAPQQAQQGASQGVSHIPHMNQVADAHAMMSSLAQHIANRRGRSY